MRRLRGTALALALAVAAFGLLAGPAGGKRKPAKSKVNVQIGFVSGTGQPFFEGELRSGRRACVENRPVGIWFQRNRGKLRFFGRDFTDAAGYYRVTLVSPMRVGGYLARVKPRRGCRLGLSLPIGVGQNGPGGINN